MNVLLARLREQRDSLKATMDGILAAVEVEQRDQLTEVEDKNFRDATEAIKVLDARIAELSDVELRNAAAAELDAKVDAAAGRPAAGVAVITAEEATYRPDQRETSFYRDLMNANDFAAQERLHRHSAETRDVATSGLSGMVPPAYLTSDYAQLAKAGRPVANTIPNRGAPSAMTMYVPKVTTGGTVGFQSSENADLGESDPALTNVTAVVRTIGGYVDISRQALDFGQVSDRDIFEMLVQDHAGKIETMVINSSTASNKGFLQETGLQTVTYTSASPTAAELYSKLGEASSEINTDTFSAPEVIFCTPAVWNWIRSRSDSAGRPLAADVAPQNSIARFGSLGAEGVVGSLYGLPVVVSTLVPKGTGGASTHNNIVVARVSDSRLWESPVQSDSFVDVGSATHTVRLRLVNYVAQTHARRPENFATIIGSGTICAF